MHRASRLSFLSLLFLSFLSQPGLAAPDAAARVMTFTVVHATTGVDVTGASVSSSSAFRETGSRFNFVYTLRDEVVIEDGLRTTSHYRDVSYDVEGHWRDLAQVGLDVTAIGEHTAQFWVIGTLLPAQVPRLVDGLPGFQSSMHLSGDYRPGQVPEYPDLPQPPAPPVFADTSSGIPVALSTWANYDPDGSFEGGASHAFTGSPGIFRYEYSYLLYANENLLTRHIDFTFHGPGYDQQVLGQGYTELLGVDVVAVPEPGTWMMLLAGAGVLAVSRRSRSATCRNGSAAVRST